MTAESDHIRIEALIRRWVKAVREGNRTAIRADHDAGILMFDVPPPLQLRGLDEYMASWEKFLAAWSELVVFDIHDLQITSGVEVAFATALASCAGAAPDGTPHSLEFRLTMGFRKIESRWRIVHEHHSLPTEFSRLRVPVLAAATGQLPDPSHGR